jgi:hypothetical protein
METNDKNNKVVGGSSGADASNNRGNGDDEFNERDEIMMDDKTGVPPTNVFTKKKYSDEQMHLTNTEATTDDSTHRNDFTFGTDIINSIGTILLELVTILFVLYYNASLVTGNIDLLLCSCA